MFRAEVSEKSRKIYPRDVLDCALSGLFVGLASGLLIGVLLISTGVIASAAEKFQASSVGVAFCMHMFFSGLMGLLFGLLVGQFIKSLRGALIIGVFVSVVSWVFGLLVVKPLRFGQPFGIDSIVSSLPILVGHCLFGLILGCLYWYFKGLISKDAYRAFAIASSGLWLGLILGVAA